MRQDNQEQVSTHNNMSDELLSDNENQVAMTFAKRLGISGIILCIQSGINIFVAYEAFSLFRNALGGILNIGISTLYTANFMFAIILLVVYIFISIVRLREKEKIIKQMTYDKKNNMVISIFAVITYFLDIFVRIYLKTPIVMFGRVVAIALIIYELIAVFWFCKKNN